MGATNRCGLEYKDRVVIITGGSKGIGEGTARVFVDAGANVVICARGVERGTALARELTEEGSGTCHYEKCDVGNPKETIELIDWTVEHYGRLDCLVNNAGYHPPHKSIEDFTLEEYLDVMNVNMTSCFIACRRALPHLRKVKGSIINMGSLVGKIGQEGATTYCATKGAIHSFTKALAIEEARYGVRANVVLPGNIISDSYTQAVNKAERPEALSAWLASNQHCNHSGTIEEVGQVCLFLASDASSFVTGVEFIVSAGAELGYGVKWPLTFIGGRS